jgi:serine/threonine protein kinase/Tfp pilus assembly protein PilF
MSIPARGELTPIDHSSPDSLISVEMSKQLPPTIRLSGVDPGTDPDPCRGTSWKRRLLVSVLPDAGLTGLQAAAKQFQTARRQADGPAAAVLAPNSRSQDGGEPAELFEEMVRSDAAAAERLARAVTSLPEVGGQFLGFRLVSLLGKGSFGQVYLAEQGDLANRPVVLKVAADIFGESQTLAQLQHTNIVPIYSIHRADPFQAVCMPYFGATTLADVLEDLDGGNSLPRSGKMLVSTVNDHKLSTRRSLSHQSLGQDSRTQPAVPEEATAVPPNVATARDPALALQKLEGMTYVEAVLWLTAGLADGLAHAHERGILHRDLKPANILLTEDGQAMLLDFNLSEDTKLRGSATAASIGGTLPYMAPEHLQAFRDGGTQLDARSDIYSLGVILYELLTGRAPFPTYRSHPAKALDSMIGDRRRILPDVRRHNPLVSPAVASIVRHCLEADPAKRYQSARELNEDLERHLRDQDLKYAPEPSWRERLHKWSKRHPRLASATTIATVLGAALLALATVFVVRDRKLAHFEASALFQRFQEEAQDVQFKLYSRHADRGQLQEGIDRCLGALGRLQVLDNPQWRQLPGVRNLPVEDQERLEEQVGELLFLLARATALEGQYYCPASSRHEKLQDAQNYNLLAEACFGKDNCPKALWEQRADLARLLGREREAEQLAARSDQTPIHSARDYYLIAHKRAINGNYREALELLRQTTQEEPRNFSAWFVRGNCYYELLQDAQAIACYNTCVALRPDFHWSWFNRGLAHLRLRDYRQACDDFASCLRLQPNLAEAHINRARAEEGLAKFPEAIEDYTQALKGDQSPTRIYFLRAQARARAGDKAGAQRDFDQGLAGEPTDEAGWIARGLAKQTSDVPGALADFEQALRINPRSFEGLQNKAAAQDRLGKDPESLQVMEQAVQLYPDSALTRGGRGVLLARIHQRDRAVADARAALLLDLSPATLYQVACIYSLTSKENPEDRREALHLLASALRGGFGLEIVDTDTDFDPLRTLPAFKEAVAAARLLQARASGQVTQ